MKIACECGNEAKLKKQDEKASKLEDWDVEAFYTTFEPKEAFEKYASDERVWLKCNACGESIYFFT